MKVGDFISLKSKFKKMGLFHPHGLVVKKFIRHEVPMFTILWNDGEIEDSVVITTLWNYEVTTELVQAV